MASFQSFGDGLGLIVGSPLVGNPIMVKPKAMTIAKANADDVVAFHRLIVEIKAGLVSTDGSDEDFTTFTFATSVENGEVVDVDISSALRAVADRYEYTSSPTKYPYVKFQVKAYDEYMLNNETKNNQGVNYLPSASAYYGALLGKFTDMERVNAGVFARVSKFTRKPTTLPEIVAVGETYTYTPALVIPDGHTYPAYDFKDIIDYAESETNCSLPSSSVVTIAITGALTLGGHSLYALPASKAAERQVFRFINGFGVLESVSVPRVYKKQVEITSTPYVVARQETFNTFSRSTVRKTNNREAWMYSTDPMDEKWMSWYIHEFLMAEHVWMDINGTWVACTITPEEETTLRDDTERTMYSLAFSVKLDINGSPIL